VSYADRVPARTSASGSHPWQLLDADGAALPGWKETGAGGYLAYFFRTRKEAVEAGDQLARKI